jgi:hypothetical protein
MKTLYKRIERLSARIRPGAVREFTLEELCRLYWRMNKRGFKAFPKGSPFQFFADCFEREDAERAARGAVARNATLPHRKHGRVSAGPRR